MVRQALIPAFCCAGLAACGGSSRPTAASVCAADRQAAGKVLGPGTGMRIADPDPVNIECMITGHGVRLDVVAQASPRAWTAYDTVTSHLSQVFGSSSVHDSSELPLPVPGVSGNAVWVAAQRELIATNGTPTTGGSYVTVTVKPGSASAPTSLAVAEDVARATLAAAPRGSNPGS
jgi:hypothetical protein